jgi:glycosyltransferase involved in cell wall biosynthesis
MSMVALEAMAVGTPILASTAASPADLADGGGITFDLSDEALVSALKAATSWSESERTARGNAGRQLVQRRYDWSVLTDQYVALYKSLQ